MSMQIDLKCTIFFDFIIITTIKTVIFHFLCIPKSNDELTDVGQANDATQFPATNVINTGQTNPISRI